MEIRGTRITEDAQGFFSLNDMWRLSGERASKAPNEWRKLLMTRELIEVCLNRGQNPIKEKNPSESVVYSRRGRGGGTFAHVVLALAYAEYLNPELAYEVREIALRVYAGDVTVLDEFNRARQEQLHEDGDRIMAREEIRRHNDQLNRALKKVGAVIGRQWANMHNEGYKGLYDGRGENELHAMRGLKPAEAILDHMGLDELAANMMRTSMAKQRIKNNPVESAIAASKVHRRCGEIVRRFLIDNQMELPENLPVYPSIKQSYRRLRLADKARAKNKVK